MRRNPDRLFQVHLSVVRDHRERLAQLEQLSHLPLTELARRCFAAGLPIVEAEIQNEVLKRMTNAPDAG